MINMHLAREKSTIEHRRRIKDHQEIVKPYQKVVRAYNNFEGLSLDDRRPDARSLPVWRYAER